jgi:hypothetical protein
MDQGRSDIGQDVRHIGETRQAISKKLERLEHRVQEPWKPRRPLKTTVEQMAGHGRQTARGGGAWKQGGGG